VKNEVLQSQGRKEHSS